MRRSRTNDAAAARRTPPSRRWRASLPSVAVLCVLLLAVVATSAVVHQNGRDAERRVLDAQANDAANVVSSVADRAQEALRAGREASVSPERFTRWLAIRPGGFPGRLALVDVRGRSPRVIASLDGQELRTVDQVGRRELVASARDERLLGLFGPREERLISVATPGIRPGQAVVLEVDVSLLVRRLFGGTGRVTAAVYLAGLESEQTLVGATTDDLPIRGERVERSLNLGVVPALLVARRDQSLIDGMARTAARLVLGLGALLAIGIAGMVEILRRRRDRALGLVEQLRASNDELDRLSETMARQALHDPLTGLGNRTMLLDHLGSTIDRPRPGRVLALMIIDLDAFKEVNDTMGHAAGDALLIEVARRLEEPLPMPHRAFRLAGDEFAVIAECRDEPEAPGRVADMVLGRVCRPVVVDHREAFVAGSVGIALATPGTTHDEILRNADIAMYRAKERVTGQRWESFDPEMLARIRERTALGADLRDGIADGELEVEYQPIVEMAGGRTVLIEALVRWRHASRGRLQPATFIGIAEETGAIVALGEFVLARACADCAELRRTHPDLRVSVNVSGRQLKEPDFARVVARVLAAAALDGEALVIEITESVLILEREVQSTLAALRDLGVGLAIDDFGSGYSSIDYLRRLRVDVVKVDRSVVQEDALPGGGRLLGAIVQLGRSLGLATLAEGIETPAQEEMTRECGFDFGQGFHFGRPCSREQIGAMLRAERDGARTEQTSV